MKKTLCLIMLSILIILTSCSSKKDFNRKEQVDIKDNIEEKEIPNKEAGDPTNDESEVPPAEQEPRF